MAENKLEVKVGDIINNGSLVLAQKITVIPRVQIVLCWTPNQHGEYVTWDYDGGSGSATSGHYYSEEEFLAAVADFEKRS